MVTTKPPTTVRGSKVAADAEERFRQQSGADDSNAQVQQSGERTRRAEREQGADESDAFTIDLIDSWFKP